MARIGVFNCHCGTNISATVSMDWLFAEAQKIPGVAHVGEYKFMCASPGQKLIVEAIQAHQLTGIVVVACSPALHERTFQEAARTAGLNPYLVEMANIREHCSWVHQKGPDTDAKALAILRMAVAKCIRNAELTPGRQKVTRAAMVIGAGIAGIGAALDIAAAGHPVYLVERQPFIGGRMAQLEKTFPTLDCAPCILTPRMVEAGRHPNITLLTNTDVIGLDGAVGNFKVRLRRRPRYIIEGDCTGCSDCIPACVNKKGILSPFQGLLGRRPPVDMVFAQAVPMTVAVDPDTCLLLTDGHCPQPCIDACEPNCFDFTQQPVEQTVAVGAIVLATGFRTVAVSELPQYGGGEVPDVINHLQLERLLDSSGPTGGRLRRPSDGRTPRHVVFIQCAGQRDPVGGVPYCSKVCCMSTAKQALLLKERWPETQVTIFYIDIRTGGKNYEEFYQSAQARGPLRYLRGRVSRLYRQGDRVVVRGEDSLLGRVVTEEADLVVAVTAMAPETGSAELGRILGASFDQNGFFNEAHPKLGPVEGVSAGIYLAGVAAGPKDISESVTAAAGAAGKVLGLLAQDELELQPQVAAVDAKACVACWKCRDVCPYLAVQSATWGKGPQQKTVAQINPAVCTGCGICVSACPPKCIELAGNTDEQILAEVEACLAMS